MSVLTRTVGITVSQGQVIKLNLESRQVAI